MLPLQQPSPGFLDDCRIRILPLARLNSAISDPAIRAAPQATRRGLTRPFLLSSTAHHCTHTYAHRHRYLGFFGTMFLPIDIAEAYASRTWQVQNVTEVSTRGACALLQ